MTVKLGPERVRLFAIELEGIQLAGDVIARDRRDAGVPDEKLEDLMARLAHSRERLVASIEGDR